MRSLANEGCTAPRPGLPPLAGDELHTLHVRLDGGWRLVDEDHLEKDFGWTSFQRGLVFARRVGCLGDRVGHRPRVQLAPGRVHVELRSDEIGGLTRTDFILAARADRVAEWV